jgi:hypothetical protein
MFALGDEMPPPAKVRDTLAELTSMIGDRVRMLVANEGSFLSLPIVVEGRNYSVEARDTRIVARWDFLTEGQPVAVTVLEAAHA